MADKKSTSRIIDEMNKTMRGLHRCCALTTKELKKIYKEYRRENEARQKF